MKQSRQGLLSSSVIEERPPCMDHVSDRELVDACPNRHGDESSVAVPRGIRNETSCELGFDGCRDKGSFGTSNACEFR